VTFVQRFGSLLVPNPHFHVMAPDGVLAKTEDGQAVYQQFAPPTDEEVRHILERTATRILRAKERYENPPDGCDEERWAMQEACTESLMDQRREIPWRERPELISRTGALSYLIAGFSLHANTEAPQGNRKRLEHLVRYGARPAFAQKRLSLLPSGKVCYRLRKPYVTGQTELVLPPVAFLRRLATLIPPPRSHLVRFHGALAPNAKLRKQVVALVPKQCSADEVDLSTAKPDAVIDICSDDSDGKEVSPAHPRYRQLWAQLLSRTFAQDVLECPECKGRMRLISMINEPTTIEKILAYLGLPTSPPVIATARPPPQLEIIWEQDGWFELTN